MKLLCRVLGLVWIFSGGAWAAPGGVEADFVARSEGYRHVVGETDEQSCGGNSLGVFLEGKRVRKFEYVIESSTQIILREFYFEGSKPLLAVETLSSRRDAEGVEYKSARPVWRARVDLSGDLATAQQREFWKQAQFLLGYYREHVGDFHKPDAAR